MKDELPFPIELTPIADYPFWEASKACDELPGDVDIIDRLHLAARDRGDYTLASILYRLHASLRSANFAILMAELRQGLQQNRALLDELQRSLRAKRGWVTRRARQALAKSEQARPP